MVQGKINRGDTLTIRLGATPIRTQQCPPPPSPIFYSPDALPAVQPTALELEFGRFGYNDRCPMFRYSDEKIPIPIPMSVMLNYAGEVGDGRRQQLTIVSRLDG